MLSGFELYPRWVPLDPEGQLSDQSDIPANSEVSEIVINCVVSKDSL